MSSNDDERITKEQWLILSKYLLSLNKEHLRLLATARAEGADGKTMMLCSKKAENYFRLMNASLYEYEKNMSDVTKEALK